MTKPAKKRKPSAADRRRAAGVLVIAAAALAVLVFCLTRPATVVEETDPPQPTLEPNPYDSSDFTHDGGWLRCTREGSLVGVDVSEHQPGIDWEQAAQSGVEFAMIRLGYRGYTEGQLFADLYALENLKGAKDAGLLVGAYFYSQAVTVEEAEAEAAYALNLLGKTKLDLPLVFDWEYVSEDARTGDMDGETLTACAQAFCRKVEQSGYDAMVYFNLDIGGQLALEELTDYGFWLAYYQEDLDYPHRVQLWQYSCTGAVPGIPGDVDLNIWLP